MNIAWWHRFSAPTGAERESSASFSRSAVVVRLRSIGLSLAPPPSSSGTFRVNKRARHPAPFESCVPLS